MLTEAALRLVPAGERAVDLGSGTGLHAAVLARQFGVVITTELAERAARATRLTLALNDRAARAVVADVGAGLRPRSFDLVTANPPWVPAPLDRAGAPRLFADGGPTGSELPCRFIDTAASLLRPGGVAVVMALDVQCTDGHQPIRAACAALETAGVFTKVIPTPLGRIRPDLEDNMRARQPLLATAPHVAVVLAAASGTTERNAVAARAELLAQRWDEVGSPQVSGSPYATRV